jgi:TrmH RNA methyltransferase
VTRRGEALEVTFGLRAALAVFERRRAEIARVSWTRSVEPSIGALLAWCTSADIVSEELTDAELASVSGSPHHEGLCVAARPRAWTPPGALADLLVSTKGAAIALDRVRNAYNVGAILRTAAFFGVDAAVLGAPAPHPALAPDAVRVAEGGAERVRLCRTTDLADTLARLRARGARVVGADAAGGVDAFAEGFARPTVLVVGHEREGMSPRVRAQCDAVVAIRGAGTMDSLNVGVASGILLAEVARTRR